MNLFHIKPNRYANEYNKLCIKSNALDPSRLYASQDDGEKTDPGTAAGMTVSEKVFNHLFSISSFQRSLSQGLESHTDVCKYKYSRHIPL